MQGRPILIFHRLSISIRPGHSNEVFARWRSHSTHGLENSLLRDCLIPQDSVDSGSELEQRKRSRGLNRFASQSDASFLVGCSPPSLALSGTRSLETLSPLAGLSRHSLPAVTCLSVKTPRPGLEDARLWALGADSLESSTARQIQHWAPVQGGKTN